MPQNVNPPADWKNLEAHPVAAMFPAMTYDEFQTLKQDILERGQQEPILLYEDKILDGKARHRACKELDLMPQFAEWDGDQNSLAAWLQVKGNNLVRQHLAAESRAAIMLLSAQALPEVQQNIQAILGAAEMRKQLGIKVAGQKAVKGEAADLLGKWVGVSGSTMKRVIRVKEEFPARLKDLAEGKTTCSKILKPGQQPAAAQPPAPAAQPVKTYQLIYADLAHAKVEKKPVPSWAAIKSAVFLWTPAPRVQEAIKLLLTWGWEYRTMFVWDKSGKEVELLLLATRNHPPAVYTAAKVVIKEKAPQDGGKPELFRELAVNLFPQTEGSRLDLFSPVVPDSWDKEPVAADAAAAA